MRRRVCIHHKLSCKKSKPLECPVQVKEEVNFVYEQESFVKNHNVRDERTECYLNFVMAIDTVLKNIV